MHVPNLNKNENTKQTDRLTKQGAGSRREINGTGETRKGQGSDNEQKKPIYVQRDTSANREQVGQSETKN